LGEKGKRVGREDKDVVGKLQGKLDNEEFPSVPRDIVSQ